MHTPPALVAGARVALVAPSGPLRSADELEVAAENARDFGWEPVIAPHALARHGYLAGTDEERADDLNAALADPAIDAVWCVRGGYGAMRILTMLDYDALRRRPKAIIGYSDVTALHAAISTKAGLVTYHGPTARAPFTAFSRASFSRAMIDQSDSCGVAPAARTLRPGRATGRLVGGNLALLAALVGTPFAPDYAGAILVIEDVGETTYRIDRMLQQLLLSGALSALAGIAFGQFTDGTPADEANACPLDELLADVANRAGVPAMAGIPMGHVDDQWTIPLGALAELDTVQHTVHVIAA
jgi:muramoyltetrapeptide carboxypeptidase